MSDITNLLRYAIKKKNLVEMLLYTNKFLDDLCILHFQSS